MASAHTCAAALGARAVAVHVVLDVLRAAVEALSRTADRGGDCIRRHNLLTHLFPRQIDNFYQGHVLAVWLFVPVLAMKTLMGFNVGGLNPFISSRFILATADGVPVDTYPPDAAAHLVFTFAAWGLALFVLTLFSWIVLIRYRA